MDPSDFKDEIDREENSSSCAIYNWLRNNDPDYVAQFARLLDSQLDTYPLSGEKTVSLLKRVGIAKGAGRTTVRTHRNPDTKCVDCQGLFASRLHSGA